jgi:hypothetical protein
MAALCAEKHGGADPYASESLKWLPGAPQGIPHCCIVERRVGRLSPALLEPALLLLVAFGCNVMISRGQDHQCEGNTKETPMKVTKKTRSREIVKITTSGFLTTVANVAVALGAATSG